MVPNNNNTAVNSVVAALSFEWKLSSRTTAVLAREEDYFFAMLHGVVVMRDEDDSISS